MATEPTASVSTLDVDRLRTDMKTMLTMRGFEELVRQAVVAGEIHGEMHLGTGQEAIAAVMKHHLQATDAVVSTHRAHLHALAAGVDAVGMLAELLERDGMNHGKGGHMHLFDPAHLFMCTGIVGAGAPMALGYALRQHLHQPGALTVAVMGDGAMNQGAVFESLNLAAVHKLPVLFLCEDNGYGISVQRDDATAGQFLQRAAGFTIPGYECEGFDVPELEEAFSAAFGYVRREGRPALVVAKTYRFRGHYEGDYDLYRPKAEKELAMGVDRDPIRRIAARLKAMGVSESDLSSMQEEVDQQLKSWNVAAHEIPLPRPSDARRGVYVDS